MSVKYIDQTTPLFRHQYLSEASLTLLFNLLVLKSYYFEKLKVQVPKIKSNWQRMFDKMCQVSVAFVDLL